MFLLKSWIVFCTASRAFGWLLSVIGQLSVRGYVIAIALAIVLGSVAASGEPFRWRISVHRLLRKPLPLMFTVVALLGFAGGIFYPPNNYDALSYRLPRLLQWLVVGHWNWIIAANERLNYSAQF
jgi:hypothetical protein